MEDYLKSPQYYYLRRVGLDGRTVPYGTVAVQFNVDGTVNRGIAYCSERDQFRKSVGRKKAFARLQKVNREGADILAGVYRGDIWNSSISKYFCFSEEPLTLGDFHSEMNDLEKRMFERFVVKNLVAER